MAHEQLDILLELGVNFIDTAELHLDAKRNSCSAIPIRGFQTESPCRWICG